MVLNHLALNFEIYLIFIMKTLKSVNVVISHQKKKQPGLFTRDHHSWLYPNRWLSIPSSKSLFKRTSQSVLKNTVYGQWYYRSLHVYRYVYTSICITTVYFIQLCILLLTPWTQRHILKYLRLWWQYACSSINSLRGKKEIKFRI